MATTVATPDDDERCAHCGCRIFAHDPICVRDCTAECGDPAYFCNYGCLSAHIEAHDLAVGSTCEWPPE